MGNVAGDEFRAYGQQGLSSGAGKPTRLTSVSRMARASPRLDQGTLRIATKKFTTELRDYGMTGGDPGGAI